MKILFFSLIIFISLFDIDASVFAQQTPEQIIDQSVSDPIGSASVSCPVPGGKILTMSYQTAQAASTVGHCTNGYSFTCSCAPGQSRRAKAIDIETKGQDVVLPKIGGQDVQWKLMTANYPINGFEGGGVGNTFEATLGSDKWYLDMLHLQSTSLILGGFYPSGTAVAKTVGAHVHATIGKNLKSPVSAGSVSDCDPGWISSDFMCDPTKQPPAGTSPSTTGVSSSTGKSNKVCTKVGNPTGPSPCLTGEATSGGGTPAGEAPSVEAANLKQTIKDQFGIDMQGAWGEQALRWVYEKFYQLKQTNPKFVDLVKGQPIVLIADPAGANAFENIVKVGQGYSEGEKFLGTLIHEMSHVIYWTKPLNLNFRAPADGLYGNPGAVTSYGASNITENYPEMISYCLTKRPVGSLISQERWVSSYKPLAEQITGGSCL